MTPLPISDAPRRLGKSDLAVAPIAYGMWRFAGTDAASARRKLEAAIEAGITLFDTADIYGLDGGHGVGAAETLFGEVLAEAPSLREGMVLATKCGIVPGVPYDSSPQHIRRACEDSLRRMRIEVIDLYQVHRPDWLAHPDAVAGALAALRQEGKIREVGVSNHTPAQFDALQAHLPFPIATHQPELSAWCLDPLRDGVLDQCMRARVTPLAWSPLAGGRLLLGIERARREPGGRRLAALLAKLAAVAKEQGVTRSAVALAFLLVHPAGVVPIIGTQRPERILECLKAFHVELDRSDWYGIVTASEGAPLP
jgi:predicted oxidoreductase